MPTIQKSSSIAIGIALLLGIGLYPVQKNSLNIVVVLILLLAPIAIIFLNRQHEASPSTGQPAYKDKQPIALSFRAFFIACAFYFTSCVISFLQEDRNTQLLSDFDLPFRFLLIPLSAILLLKLTQRNPISTTWLKSGFFLAALSAFSIAIYQKYYLELYPITGGTTHHILFGGLSALIAVTCLALPFRWRWLSIIGFMLGATASLLSTSRGAWPALLVICIAHPIIIYKLQTANINPITKAHLLGMIISCLLLFGLLSAIPSTGIIDRLNLAYNGIYDYFVHNRHTSNIGLRFEMWKGAWIIFQEHWLVGVGLEEYEIAIQELREQERVRSLANNYMHPHNDLLNEMATRGLIGGISYLILILVPTYYFFTSLRWKRKRHLNNEEIGLHLAGLYTVFTFTTAGITEALLTRNLSVTYYLFIISAFYISIQQTEKHNQPEHQ